MSSVANPYYSNNFFEFFWTLSCRLFAFLSGSELHLATDELQILVLSLIAISAGLVGVFLVLRKMTMLANALSHTILAGVVLAYLAYRWLKIGPDNFDFSHLLPSESMLFLAALIMAFLTNFLTELLVTKMRMREDASCGIVFTFLFALGVVLVTVLSRNAHIGAELLMGNTDALHFDDLLFQCKVTVLNVALLVGFWRAFFVTTFDPIFSKVLGISSVLFGYILMGQTAVTTIAAFRAVGVLLVLAFFVAPPLIVRLWTNRLVPLLVYSAVTGVVASLVGVAVSRHMLSVYSLPISTSGLVVCVLTFLYFLSLGAKCCVKLKKNRTLRTLS
jgi:manganese/zinc/iron transport system permease protein